MLQIYDNKESPPKTLEIHGVFLFKQEKSHQGRKKSKECLAVQKTGIPLLLSYMKIKQSAVLLNS